MIYHLCNPETPKILDWKNISNYEDVLKINEDFASDIWLINTSLNWGNNAYASFYGFDVAQKIRTVLKSKAPIIFYSPIRKEVFKNLGKTDLKYKLVSARGSTFLKAPFSENDINSLSQKIRPLTEASLHDVSTMLCNLRGFVIDKFKHDIKFGGDIKSIFESVKPFLSELQIQSINLIEFEKKLIEKNKKVDKIGFLELKEELISLCNLKLNSEKIVSEEKELKSKYKILLIDDMQDELDEISSKLSSHFEIISTTNSEKAIEIINSDVSNEIVAIVSDWRLYEDGKDDWQVNYQGYEILEYASRKGLRALFTLTKQADFLVHDIRNLMNIKFHAFKKEQINLLDQWEEVVRIIHDACKVVVNLISSLPIEAKQWTKVLYDSKTKEPLKTLQQQYLEVWNSSNKDEYFNGISEKADKIWSYLLSTPKNKQLNIEFGISIPTKKLVLEPILIYRRIWLALWFNEININKKISKDTISNTSFEIYKRMFSPASKEPNNSSTQNAFKLCIEIYNIQKGHVLPEEKEWLLKHKLL